MHLRYTFKKNTKIIILEDDSFYSDPSIITLYSKEGKNYIFLNV